ncbi:PAS domain-containing protein (plasmid) [Deinococcus taeanensis]|uniref:PAS domain-containing protein n=1 Tax=Deinococcus taeanensis TaxID=2737050 RepID=UPI001CDB8628|nr:PAS domain-containing protein [Deinococcus taeanensis]UBV45411.1 PAS domain-containing protein [Deinococcus taeanensis]
MISVERLSEGLLQGLVAVDSALQVTFFNERARFLLRKPGLRAGVHLQEMFPGLAEDKMWSEFHRAVNQRVSVEFDVFHPALFRWHEIRVVPDEDGGLVLLFRDVTERQWTIEKDTEHAYLRNLFQEAPVAVYVLRGPQHQFEYCNDFARNLVGGRPLEGLTVREAFPELQGQGYFELLDQVYTTETPFHGREMPAVLTDPATGETRNLVVNFSYIPFRGFDAKVTGILSLTVDVTAYVAGTRTTPV